MPTYLEDPSLQRRTIGVLAAAQVVGGLGSGAGIAVGALLVEDISGSAGLAGLALSFMMLGATALTVPLSNLALRHGRRPALSVGWLIAAIGTILIVAATILGSVPLALFGFALFGSSSATNLQSRFAAADRADGAAIGRSISIVVWSTTVGSVIGPNLTGPGAAIARRLGLADLAGPMVMAVVAFLLAGATMWWWLRPDPLVPEMRHGRERPKISSAFPHVRGRVAMGITATALAHAVMVAIMAMTPVHMKNHDAALSIIGLTISLHIAGMYALSPVMGWLSDKWGAERTILLGIALLLGACAAAGGSGDSITLITLALILLGLGWSAATIAGAALVTSSTELAVRPLVQGFSDMTMNGAGALGSLLAGVVVWALGFAALTVFAAFSLVPVTLIVVRALRTN